MNATIATTSGAATKSGMVFVSHATEDAPLAGSVVQALEAAGLDCFLASRDIAPGAAWAEELMAAIVRCPVFLVLCTAAASASDHVLREVTQALHNRRRLIPIRLEARPLPPKLDYFLTTSQWVDASSRPLAEALRDVIDALQAAAGTAPIGLLGRVAPPRSAAPAPTPQIPLDDVFRTPPAGRLSRWFTKLMEDR